MSLVLDTGPIVALLNRGDPDHERCARVLAETSESLVVPGPVMVEVDYWCRKLIGLEALEVFIADLMAGAYLWHDLGLTGLERAIEIELQYRELQIGLVDAAVIATCEMLDEERVVTLDRRHFSVIRPMHRQHLTLLPE